MERIRAFIFDYRRPLAAACAALAVLAAIESMQPSTPTSSITVAARDISSGQVLVESDLTTVDVPDGSHPTHLLSASEAVGRQAAGPMRQGEAVTDRRVVSPRDLGDEVLSMVRVDDPATLIGLRVGDRVDVAAAASEDGRSAIVAEGATVAVLPDPESDQGATIGLTTTPDNALNLADAATLGGIRLIVRT